MPETRHDTLPSPAGLQRRLHLRHLRCALAVARHGSLRRAAEVLSISQPAVTKTLNEVEALLGRPLFLRTSRGVALAPGAEAFLAHAADAVAALNRAVESGHVGTPQAPLRIGVLPSVSPSLLPPVLQAYAQHWPQMHLRLEGGSNEALLNALRQHELDVVIGRMSEPSALAGLRFEHLYSEPLVVVSRPGHPAARQGTDPGHWPLVLPPTGTLIRQLANEYLYPREHPLAQGAIETLDVTLAQELVKAGDYLWFAPLGAVLPELRRGGLVRLPIDITPLESVGVITHADKEPDGRLSALLVALREQARLRHALEQK